MKQTRLKHTFLGWEEWKQKMKGLYEELLEEEPRIESIYDFVAFNYMFLQKRIREQDVFLGTYIMENKRAKAKNPNLGRLREFSQKMQDKLTYHAENGILFSFGLSELKQMIKELEDSLLRYCEEVLNQAAIPYFILCTLDRYIGDRYRQGKWNCSKTAPLNGHFQDNVYVYLDLAENFIDRGLNSSKTEDNHSRNIQRAYIRDNINHFIFIEHGELPEKAGVPKVIPLWMSDGKKAEWIKEKNLKIAVIPFSDHTPGLETVFDYGACFHIGYTDDYIMWGKERAVALLNLAVRKKANIIVFPEFVCCQEIQNAIQKRIKEMYRDTVSWISSLLFVCAGSGWTSDNNNVAVLYSYDGYFLGNQYKYSKYHTFGSNENDYYENLQSPEKETTILQIDGIGKVMSGICRDVVDRGYIRQLTEIFSPQIILTPAWSRSVNKGFLGQFKELASISQRTCSVLCNCCTAFSSNKKFRSDIGIVVTLQQKESLLEGKENKIKRCEKDCLSNCKIGGCLFLAELSFAQKAIKEGKMVKNIEQYFLDKKIE